MEKLTVDYRYRNRRAGVTKIWLSWPTEHEVRRNTEILLVNRESEHVSEPDPAGNRLVYYELEPGEEVRLRYRTDGCAYRPGMIASPLGEEERSFYLRSTSMVPVNGEMREKAEAIVGNAVDDRERACRLFEHLVREYAYVYPPKERGAASMMRAGKGDCGEFSFLYASWCRSLGIPCRVLTGAYATGIMPHVWNEVWLKDEGWIPVDSSAAAVQRKQIWRMLFSDVRTLPWRRYFGHLEGPRIVFSIDTDLRPDPVYPEAENVPEGSQPFLAGGVQLHWGYQTLKGNFPYLQPAYPRFPDTGKQEKKSRWVGFVTGLLGGWTADDELGRWKVTEPGWRGAAAWLKSNLLKLVWPLLLIHWFLYDPAKLFFYGSMALYSLLSLIRRERPVFYTVFSVLMILSLLCGLDRWIF